MIDLSRIENPDEEVQIAVKNWDPRFETSGRRTRARWDFRWGGERTQTNPTGLSSGGSIRWMDSSQKTNPSHLSSMLSIGYSEIRAGC
jgi:hypothetical protein